MQAKFYHNLYKKQPLISYNPPPPPFPIFLMRPLHMHSHAQSQQPVGAQAACAHHVVSPLPAPTTVSPGRHQRADWQRQGPVVPSAVEGLLKWLILLSVPSATDGSCTHAHTHTCLNHFHGQKVKTLFISPTDRWSGSRQQMTRSFAQR